MRPVNTNGIEWSRDTADMALQEIRAQAIQDLLDRDEQRSGGRMCKANNYAAYTEHELKNKSLHPEQGMRRGNIQVVIDPVLASIRHTGDEEQQLLAARWAEFCSEPRDEEPYRHKIQAKLRTERIKQLLGRGQDVEKSLTTAEPLPVTNTPTTAQPPKRKRGRPRKTAV